VDSYITTGSSGDLSISVVLIMMGLNIVNSFMKITVEIPSWLNIYMYSRNFEHFRVCFPQILVPKEGIVEMKCS